MELFQQLAGAALIAFTTVLCGIGAGCLSSVYFGTNTVTGRGRCMIVGLLTGLFTLWAMIWFGYHGFRI